MFYWVKCTYNGWEQGYKRETRKETSDQQKHFLIDAKNAAVQANPGTTSNQIRTSNIKHGDNEPQPADEYVTV